MGNQNPAEVLRECAATYEQKNEDYGGSWRLAGETLAMWADELDIEELDPTDERQMISVGLYFQRLHKITRGFNLEFGSGDPNNEPIPESHSDEAAYAGIHASFVGESGSSTDGSVSGINQRALCIDCGEMKQAEHFAETDHDYVGEGER